MFSPLPSVWPFFLLNVGSLFLQAGGAGSLVDHDRHGPRVGVVLAAAVAAPGGVPLHPGRERGAGGHDGCDGDARWHPGGRTALRHQIPALLQAR